MKQLDTRSGRIALLTALMMVAVTVAAQEPLPPPDDVPEPPPVLALYVPEDLQVPVCAGVAGAAGRVAVHYPAPRLVTPCEKGGSVSCTPPSGSVFPVGRTVVECVGFTECDERTNSSFTVVVLADTAPPRVSCPADQMVYAVTGEGAVVDYPRPDISDDADPSPQLVCTPPSGSTFVVGISAVKCAVTDACGNEASCAFQVEVRRAELAMRPTLIPDPAGGRTPGVSVTPIGLGGVDVATALDGDWEPMDGTPILDAVALAPAKFYRPPAAQGVKRGPDQEIAYVNVGLLPAYDTPGLNPARILTDTQTDFGVKLMSGDDGGSGANRWSGPKDLPFTFYFYGRPYKKFRVSKNGLLTFSTNIVSGTEGLNYFNFAQANITNALTTPLPLWAAGFNVDNTIFCMAGRHVPQTSADDVYGFLHGSAPYRQVWVLFRHAKDFYGRTITGVVLEETSNRILLMDMDADARAGATNRLVAGIQGTVGNAREVSQVRATPSVRLMATNASLGDNGCYLFRPYVLGAQVTGQGAASILAATNLDRFISEQIRVLNAPGATVAISRNGRLIFNKGYGWANVEKSEKMQPYHRACIGSVSKVLATIGVEKLIDQGAIPGLAAWAYAPSRLGKPWFWAGVNQGVTNNIHSNAWGSATFLNNLSNSTVRHLLAHAAAFDNRNDDVRAARAYANSNYTELTAQDQVRWHVASRWQITNAIGVVARYSNPTWKHVGVLIEEVAGQPFESWMQAQVMIPAGVSFARLMRTYEFEETWRDARRYLDYASGDPWGVSRITGQFGPLPYGDAIYANAADGAAGSWTATAADLVRLMAATDGLPNRPDILSADRLDEMDSLAFPGVPGTGDQGLGWDNVKALFAEKNGNIGYGSSYLRRARTADRLTVAVVFNSGAVPDSLAVAIFNAVQPLLPVSPFYDLFGPQFGF